MAAAAGCEAEGFNQLPEHRRVCTNFLARRGPDAQSPWANPFGITNFVPE